MSEYPAPEEFNWMAEEDFEIIRNLKFYKKLKWFVDPTPYKNYITTLNI